MSREFGTVGVVGLGTMGAGIAEVFARHGFDVVGVDQTDEQVKLGWAHVRHSTDRARSRAKLTETEQQDLFDRLTLTTSIRDLKECDLVVEAVVERLDAKQAIFEQLDDIVSSDAVLATNTSSLSVTEIASSTAFPGRVIGMHFFNPAPIQTLVEVVHTVVTEPAVVADAQELARTLGKNPVVVGDKAGFIANALLFGYLNSAMSMLEDGYASREDIDDALRLGCGYPMGPLQLLDLIGLDTAYQVLQAMYQETRDQLHAPPPILRQMVTAGLLGRKTGRGFYAYEAPSSPLVVDDQQTPHDEATAVFKRSIASIGVVGSGELALGIIGALTGAGYEAVQVPRPDTGLAVLADVDLVVVEATGEGPETVMACFEELGTICRDGAILATTTSTRPVVELAVASGRLHDVIGMHVHTAGASWLVEVVSTVATSDEATESVRALCASVGWHAVSCGDRAGFIVDALVFPYLNDAVRMLERGYAGVDDIDTAMKQGCALPRGPFEVLDDVGNDVVLAGEQSIFREFRQPGLAPARLLGQLVTAGRLGRRTGRGFREYPQG